MGPENNEAQEAEAQQPEENKAEETKAAEPAPDAAEPQDSQDDTASDAAALAEAKGGRRPRGSKDAKSGPPNKRREPRSRDAQPRQESEWKEKVIQIRRVTKVVKGGKKLSFRAVVVVGNGSGQVGLGIGKSSEVIGAIQKAVSAARKNVIVVSTHKSTIPHPIEVRLGGSRVMLRPASKGTGVIAGGAARSVLELAGVEDILSKSLGSNSPLNVARATIKALDSLRSFTEIAEGRGLTVSEMIR